MRRCRRCRERARPALADDGSAAVEFIFAGLILLVPLVYLIVALGMIQGQALGVESGARHAARVIAAAPDAQAANARAETVLHAIGAEYGLDEGTLRMRLDCRSPGACPRAGGVVAVTVSARVTLPLVPPVLGLDRIASVPVQAVSVQRMSRQWAGG